MEITTATSFVGFLVTLTALNLPATAAVDLPQTDGTISPNISEKSSLQPDVNPSRIDDRLARLTVALRAREAQLPETSSSSQDSSPEDMMTARWINTSGGAWVNRGRAGWADRNRGGGFLNTNPWRNGWGDRGGFLNRNPWRNGGGGWINRR